MARQRRAKSSTGIYHVMLKGIDDRNIFLDDGDRIQFIKCLKRAKSKGEFFIYAYCLMNNHIHLVMKETEELGISIKRIAVQYSFYHNKKYERNGHLFNNRFRSEVIELEDSLLRVIAYVHKNPVKAGITKDLNYMWSSHQEYINLFKNKPTWMNIKFIKKYYNSIDSYYNEIMVKEEESFIDYFQKPRYTDDELYQIIKEKVVICKINEIKTLKTELRNLTIKGIREKTQASNRQLSRVLGVGRNIIDRA